MKLTSKTVTIYNREITPEVGSVVWPDNWSLSEKLLPGDDFSTFRIPCGSPIYESLAVEVEVTGRTLKRKAGDLWVRVRIVFPGDGEPDVEHRGWMLVPW